MAKSDERTLQMMEAFIGLHEKGYSIPEIAKMFNLSWSIVYKKLGEIADKAGVTRESLLMSPIKADHSGRNFTPVKPIDVTKFHEHFNMAITELDAISKEVAQAIEDQETISKILEEDF